MTLNYKMFDQESRICHAQKCGKQKIEKRGVGAVDAVGGGVVWFKQIPNISFFFVMNIY